MRKVVSGELKVVGQAFCQEVDGLGTSEYHMSNAPPDLDPCTTQNGTLPPQQLLFFRSRRCRSDSTTA